MALYNYYCPKCDKDFDFHLPVDHDPPFCPSCKDNGMKKCLTSANFTVKGFSAKNNYSGKS